MPLLVVDLLFGSLVAVLGAALGWWLCSRMKPAPGLSTPRMSPSPSDEPAWVREVVARLRALTTGMATSVDDHSNRVQRINDELASMADQNPEAVAAAVASLIEANDQMRTQLATAEEKLKQQALQIEAHAAEARTDPLTQLANRRGFDDELARRFAEFQRQGSFVSMMLMDVDHFKNFNDVNGHQVGDEILRGIAAVLRQTIRTMDLAARYGGEEFGIILPGTSLDAAKEAAERARRAIEQAAFRYEGKDFHVTVSVGVAQLLPTEQTSRLVGRADEALYASKMSGRNCTHCHLGTTLCRVSVKKDRPLPARETPPPEMPSKPSIKDAESEALVVETSEINSSQPRLTPPSDVISDTADQVLRLCDRTSFCQQVRCRIAEWQRGGVPLSLILTDIDEYEEIHLQYGKQVGSKALDRLVRIFHSVVREMDVAGRYAHNRFALLLPRTQLAEAAEVAERLHGEVSQCTLSAGGEEVRFTISVGLTNILEGDDLVRLMRRVEAALHSARDAGGNATYYHNGQGTQLVTSMADFAMS